MNDVGAGGEEADDVLAGQHADRLSVVRYDDGRIGQRKELVCKLDLLGLFECRKGPAHYLADRLMENVRMIEDAAHNADVVDASDLFPSLHHGKLRDLVLAQQVKRGL